MKKLDFILTLRSRLLCLPEDVADEWLLFYSEMIDDRMEEGLSEEEAVAAAGSMDEIVQQIIAETPLAAIAKKSLKPKRRLNALEIVLLILGSPIWFSLLLSGFAVVFSIYVVLWSVIISLWAVFVSVAISSIAVIVAGIVLICSGNALTGVVMLGAALICAGLSILMFFGCKAATKGILLLTKQIGIWIKNCFIKKGEVS